MAFALGLPFLLSKDYDPTDNSPSRFRQAYNDLASYRDELREKLNDKEQRRAKFNQAKGQYLSRGTNPRKNSELTSL